jgi:uncharacterized membrane protein
MSSETDSTAITAWWAELPPVEKARLWEKVAPGTAGRILDQTERQVRHARRLAWANIALSGFKVASAFATVILFVWLAKYYADHHDATQGAAIIGALAAVVTAFIGGRVLSEKRSSDDRSAVSREET